VRSTTVEPRPRAFERRLDPGRDGLHLPGRCRQEHVAGRLQRRDLGGAGLLEERRQVGHREPVGAAHVEAAQERHVARG